MKPATWGVLPTSTPRWGVSWGNMGTTGNAGTGAGAAERCLPIRDPLGAALCCSLCCIHRLLTPVLRVYAYVMPHRDDHAGRDGHGVEDRGAHASRAGVPL